VAGGGGRASEGGGGGEAPSLGCRSGSVVEAKSDGSTGGIVPFQKSAAGVETEEEHGGAVGEESGGEEESEEEESDEEEVDNAEEAAEALELHKQLRWQLGMLVHDDAKSAEKFTREVDKFKAVVTGQAPRPVGGRGRRVPAPAAEDGTNVKGAPLVTSAQWDARLEPVRTACGSVMELRKQNADEMERRLELIPLTTLQLMTELDVWQRKGREAEEREKVQRQKMESHQRNLEKLQVGGRGGRWGGGGGRGRGQLGSWMCLSSISNDDNRI
jgi:hypothetical protein